MENTKVPDVVSRVKWVDIMNYYLVTPDNNLIALKLRYLCESFFIKFYTYEDDFRIVYNYDVAIGKQLQFA